jgi:hypothetical protein
MYYKTYMQEYYLDHKEKIKKQSMEWREKNPGRLKIIQNRYRIKRGLDRDFREEKIEVLPFKERVSKETLAKMKENSRINQRRIKYYEWPEDYYPKKSILEGV